MPDVCPAQLSGAESRARAWELVGKTMEERIAPVLLLHNQSGPLQALSRALGGQSVRIRQAGTCKEASRLLAGPEPPELVFTDTQLPDGNWADVVRMGEKAPSAVNVIVVSRLVDVRFYVEAIQNGAFDFIVPPFEASELSHIVRCALGNVAARRSLQRCSDPLLSERGQLPLPMAS